MPNNRGATRHTKAAVYAPLALPAQSDLSALSTQKIDALEHKAVTYLERELNILTSTPGNFSEVARILKILKDHRGPKGEVRSGSSKSVKSWSLED